MYKTTLIVLLILVVAAAIIVIAGPSPSAPTKVESSTSTATKPSTQPLKMESLPVMSEAEAQVWGEQHVVPILLKGEKDKVSGIAKHVGSLMRLAKNDKVRLSMDTEDPDTLAIARWNKECGMAGVWFNTAKLQKRRQTLSADDFRDMLLAVASHEAIHLELRLPCSDDPVASSHQSIDTVVDEEAKAWKTTILEVVRPLRQVGRYVEPRNIGLDMALNGCRNQANLEWYVWVGKNLVNVE